MSDCASVQPTALSRRSSSRSVRARPAGCVCASSNPGNIHCPAMFIVCMPENADKYDDLTRFAAESMKSNYDQIRKSDSWLGIQNASITDGDLQKFAEKSNADRSVSPEKLFKPADERADENSRPDEHDQLTDVLQSKTATPEDKMRAIEALAAQGVTSLTLTDVDGNQTEARIDVQPVAPGSSRKYVHLYGVDENGREHPLMRGLSQNGEYSSEVDRSGNKVGFYGSWWKQHNPESVFAH